MTVIHISSGKKKKRYIFILGMSTARVPNTPINAPLAPTAGLTAVKLQPSPATIPEMKKMSINLELPILRSSTGAKKTKKSILKKKCSKFPWRKICVINVQGLAITSAGISINFSV